MIKYNIYDENGELMRVVKTQEEAKQIINTYRDWFYQEINPPELPEALF